MPRFLFFPNVSKGMGGGHLFRTIKYAGKTDDASVVVPDGFSLPEEMTGHVPFIRCSAALNDTSLNNSTDTVIVFDCRKTQKNMYSFAGSNHYTVGIDEGGPFRNELHYLADITYDLVKPASGNTALSPFPDTSYDVIDFIFPFRHILVTFGSEDAEGLSRVIIDALLKDRLFRPETITAIEGPLYNKHRKESAVWPKGIEVFRNVKDMSKMLPRFDCVFTHYGITAYEAAAQGLPVILFNPSKYHRDLSRKAGFLEIGVKKVNTARLKRYLSTRSFFSEFRSRMIFSKIKQKQQTLSRLFTDFMPTGKPACPVCGSVKKKIVSRFFDRTYCMCKKCKTVRMIRFFGKTSAYSKEYFFEEYQKQYGKTYLEDFEQIKHFGKQRIRIIKNCLQPGLKRKQKPQVLDIGCAYGPFCAAVQEAGWTTAGIDMSEDAVSYVKNTLKIPAEVCDFENEPLPQNFSKEQYDALTMWYVIEHFIDTQKVLKKVYTSLMPGGIFAFSTPNSRGISALRDKKIFFKNSPSDHFTVWSPASAKKSLALNGFGIRKIRITGHHPERFFSPNSRILKKSKIILGFLTVVSKVFGLGDTFEVYAEKQYSGAVEN